jgi:hypothetical protein
MPGRCDPDQRGEGEAIFILMPEIFGVPPPPPPLHLQIMREQPVAAPGLQSNCCGLWRLSPQTRPVDALIAELGGTLADVRRDRDDWREQAQRRALLAPKAEPVEPAPEPKPHP